MTRNLTKCELFVTNFVIEYSHLACLQNYFSSTTQAVRSSTFPFSPSSWKIQNCVPCEIYPSPPNLEREINLKFWTKKIQNIVKFQSKNNKKSTKPKLSWTMIFFVRKNIFSNETFPRRGRVWHNLFPCRQLDLP